MTADHSPARYRIFLLTVWRDHSEAKSGVHGLRFRLEDPRTGERQGFGDLELLSAYLQMRMSGQEFEEMNEGTGKDQRR